jgi:hypothetical protein
MSVKIRQRDRGYRKLVKELAGGEITVGVLGQKAEEPHPDSELTVGQLAAVHELGLGVPERSWLRSWIDGNQRRIEQLSEQVWENISSGRLSRKVALEQMAATLVQEIQENVLQGGITPPLAESTITRKGHDTPLVDTKTLVSAIDYELKLKQIKSVHDRAQREILLRNQRR